MCNNNSVEGHGSMFLFMGGYSSEGVSTIDFYAYTSDNVIERYSVNSDNVEFHIVENVEDIRVVLPYKTTYKLRSPFEEREVREVWYDESVVKDVTKIYVTEDVFSNDIKLDLE